MWHFVNELFSDGQGENEPKADAQVDNIEKLYIIRLNGFLLLSIHKPEI